MMPAKICIAFALCVASAFPQEAPPGLIRHTIERETETERAQSNYTYRQTVTVEEFDHRGLKGGEYRETRDIIFLPSHERTDKIVDGPHNTLRRLKLTDEDFRDLREVQPFLLTKDRAFLYETRFRGEEEKDGIDCWVIEVKPRQILSGERLFEGLLWVEKQDYSIVRAEGKAVPEILTLKQENLFPRFTTTREKVDGYWFPAMTMGDDTLQFRSGPQRMRLTIRYQDYKRFGAESTIQYGK